MDLKDYPELKMVEDDGGGVHLKGAECDWCGLADGHKCSECGIEMPAEMCETWEGMCEDCAIMEAL